MMVIEFWPSRKQGIYRVAARDGVRSLHTYSNLFAVVHSHITIGGLLSPIVEAGKQRDGHYMTSLLIPSFDGTAEDEATQLLQQIMGDTPKAIENALRERILEKPFPGSRFRSSGRWATG